MSWVVQVLFDREIEDEVWSPDIALIELDCDYLLEPNNESDEIRTIYAEGLLALRGWVDPGGDRRNLRRMWRSTYKAALDNHEMWRTNV